MKLDRKIESILFYKAEPLEISELASIVGRAEEEIEKALSQLKENLKDRGVVLLREGDKVTLGTHPDASKFIEEILEDELNKDLGKAGLETLSIVLYRGPLTKAKIDYIRGVNSSFILRNLSTRGLIERVKNPEDNRSFLYKPTIDLLSFLGVEKVEDLPEYRQVQEEIKDFEERAQDFDEKRN